MDQYGKPTYDPDGKQRFKCGFKIGGGIDQDPAKSPQGYPDKVNKRTFMSVLLSQYHKVDLK